MLAFWPSYGGGKCFLASWWEEDIQDMSYRMGMDLVVLLRQQCFAWGVK